MGDSDDEYSHRRGSGRDKFHSERDGPGFQRGGGRGGMYGGGGRGGDWGGGRDRRDSYEYGRRRFSPERAGLSPPQKRMRRDWGDGNYQNNFGDGNRGGFNNDKSMEPEYQTQPAMQTFKAFLASQDDNITDDEAIQKYNEYKNDFKKQQINEFFLAHKEEEWFKAKYHPSECGKRLDDQKNSLKKRADIFTHLMELSFLDDVMCDIEKANDVVKVLDAAVILMEGGNDDDLKSLEENYVEEPPAEAAKPEAKSPEKPDPESDSKEETKDEEPKGNGEVAKPEVDKDENEPDAGKKDGGESGSESESEVDKSVEKGEKPDAPVEDESKVTKDEDMENGETKEEKDEKTVEEGEKEMDTAEQKEIEQPLHDKPVERGPRKLHETLSIFLRNLAPNITKHEIETMCKRYPGFMRVALQDPQPERRFFRRGWVTFERSVNIKDICWNLNNIRLRDCEMGAIVNRELKQRVRPINGIAVHKQVCKADIKHAAKIIQNLDLKWNIWDEAEKQDREKDEMEGRFGLVSKNPILKNITDYLVDEGSAEEDEYLGIIENKPVNPNPELAIERDEKYLQVLDRMILYLRVVHSFDFYSAVEYPNEDEMPHRCGIMHARGSPFPGARHTQSDVNDWTATFEQKLKPHLELRYKLTEQEAKKFGLKDEESEVEAFITANTQELQKDKWLCPLSGKKFKGPDFVRKHILNKHNEKLDEVKQDVVYFNNYLFDPKRPQLPEYPRKSAASNPPSDSYNGASGGGGYRGDGGYRGGGGGGGYERGGGGYGRGGGGGYRGHRGSFDYGHGRRGGGGGGYSSGYDRPPPESYSRRDPPQRDYDGAAAPTSRPRQPAYKNRSDPRGIVEYKDLDAPAEGDIFS